MATYHEDLSVRFFDLSKQLLLSSSPLRFEFPQPLPHLTIPIRQIIHDETLTGIFGREAIRIQSVHLSSDSLECMIVLNTGAVLVYRFAAARGRPQTLELGDLDDLLNDEEDIIVSLADLASWSSDGFKPVCVIDARRGVVTQAKMSNTGMCLNVFACFHG